jgi:phage gp29-like protein
MVLYDSFGREIKPQAKPKSDDFNSYVALENVYSDYPSVGLTPIRLAAILKEADGGDVSRQAQLFEEMEEKDTHLMSILSKRKSALTGLEFSILPFSKDKKDQEIAEFVGDVIHGLPDFEDNLKDLCDAIGKGSSALHMRWGYQKSKSRHVVEYLKWIKPERFIWRNEAPRLLTKENFTDGIALDPFQYLFHVHKTKSGSPARQGVLRICSYMYLFKNFDIKHWVQFSEIYGMPLRLGKYDSNATPDDKAMLKKAVQFLGSDGAGVISKATEIEFISTINGASGDLYEKLARFCNVEMSKAVLGQNMTTESPEKGARSLGDVHKLVEDAINRDDGTQIAKTVRAGLIRPLVGFNYGWDVNLPWFMFEHPNHEDLNAEADRYEKHLDAGVEIPQAHYYEKFQIPIPKEGEPVLVRKQTPNPFKNSQRFQAKADFKNIDPDDLVGNFIERLEDEAHQDLLIEPLRRLADSVSSLEELQDGLLDLYNETPTQGLAQIIGLGFHSADIGGRFDAETE